MGEENDSNEHEGGDEENQYGGGEGDVDAVEQTERVTDEGESDEVDDESQEGPDADG